MPSRKSDNQLVLSNIATGKQLLHSEPEDLKGAERAFRAALKVNPRSGEAQLCLGIILEKQNRISDACDAFRSSAKYLTGDPRPRILLGRCLQKANKLHAALRELQEGIKLKPHYAEQDARLMLAEVYELVGKINEAVKEWKYVCGMPEEYPSYAQPRIEAEKKLLKYSSKT